MPARALGASSDGFLAAGDLAIDGQGNVYGTTRGGANGFGTIYMFRP